MFNQLPAGKTFQARETFHHPRHGGFLLGAEDDDIDEAGGGDECRPSPIFFCRSKNAAAPNTFLGPFKFLADSLGDWVSLAKPRFSSPSALFGVTEVMKAFVDRIPSLMPSFVLIDIEDGSLRRGPAPNSN